MKKIGSLSGVWNSVADRPTRNLDSVLYVEDDDDNWQVAQLRLGGSYALSRARDAAEACQLLCERGHEFSAILMDVGLSGSDLNGVELTELIRGKLRRDRVPEYAKNVPVLSTVPIIFVTAHGAKYSDAMLLLSGGDRVIPKPVDFAALSLALTQLHLARMSSRRQA
jgi:CheY-like chemotaxis protein